MEAAPKNASLADIETLLAEFDAELARSRGGAPPAPAPDAAMAMDAAGGGGPVDESSSGDEGEDESTEETLEGGMAVDVTPIVEALGVPPEMAESLYQAAQQIESMAGQTPEQLAALWSTDMAALNNAQRVAGQDRDNAKRARASEDSLARMKGEAAPAEDAY